MKKRLFTLLLVLISMSAAAQTVGSAFYIYQNDGNFNAFLKTNVDSIVYSNIGLDGTTYDDVVTQLVYTSDSIYRIPLASIDSVAFVTPQTIVNKDVFPLTSAHDPYIADGDTTSFKMLLTTPDNMRPKKGNIVVSAYDCTAFPVGIIARVTGITQSSSYYAYTCDKASLDDVYDQLVVYEEGLAGPDSASTAAKGQKRIQGKITKILWNKTFTKTIEKSGTTTTFSTNDKAWITVTIRKTLKTPLYANFTIQNSLTNKVDFKAKSEADVQESKQLGPTLNVGRIAIPDFPFIWIQPQLSLKGYFKLGGSVEMNYSGHLNYTDCASITYNKKKWHFTYTPTSDAGTDIANISMNGYAEAGLTPQLFFSVNGSKMGIGITCSVGLKETIDFLYDATKLKGGGLYDACKDSYCKTTIPYSVNVYANGDIFKDDDSQSSVSADVFSGEPQWGSNKYILPLFTTPVNESSASGSGNVATFVSRDLIAPVTVGMRVYDSNGNMKVEQASPNSYNHYENMKFKCPYSGLQDNQEYTACPTVKIFNYTMEATPTAKFKVNISAITGSAGSITKSSAILSGTVKGASSAKNSVNVGIVYNTVGMPAVGNGVDVASGKKADGDFSVSLSGLKKNTTYYYCAYIAIDGTYYYGCVLSFTTKQDEGDVTPGEAIDLGLSVKWANHNVGATSPEGYGGYYAWGETAEKGSYTWENYKYYNASTNTYVNIGSDISGTQYDVAHVKWGGSWRMPTSTELYELKTKCTWTWTTYNGVSGMKVVGPNGNSIFLPAAGDRYLSYLIVAGGGFYWSSTVDDGDYGRSAYDLYFGSGGYGWDYGNRYGGRSVRPVSE